MASNQTTVCMVKGAYSDGTSAASSDATVRLTRDGLVIEQVGAGDVLWPYGTLSSAEPLAAHSNDVVLGSSAHEDATLYISDAHFVETLRNHAPHLTTFAWRKRAAKPLLWSTAAILVVCAVVWIADLSPSRAVADLLPEGARQTLGKNVIAGITKNARKCSTPAGDAALDALQRRLLVAGDKDRAFSVVVVNWNVTNAFAVPGAQIILTRKILEKAEGADEIAGILAHEMGHGIERHPEAGLIRAMGLTAAVQFLMGGGNSNLANMGVLLAQLSYSRGAEREADAHAVRLMKQAQISLDGLKAFFSRNQAKEKMRRSIFGRTAEFLSTHPMSKERLAQFDAASDYDTRPSLTAAEWHALKTICGPKEVPKDKPDTAKEQTDARVTPASDRTSTI